MLIKVVVPTGVGAGAPPVREGFFFFLYFPIACGQLQAFSILSTGRLSAVALLRKPFY